MKYFVCYKEFRESGFCNIVPLEILFGNGSDILCFDSVAQAQMFIELLELGHCDLKPDELVICVSKQGILFPESFLR